MPSHPERVRTASLPEGYQFGDASRAAVRHDALEDGWYDLGAIPYNPFGPMGINYAQPIGNTVRVRIPKRWSVSDTVAESFVKHSPAANRPAVLFRLGVDTCPTCGTTGQYDCPDCGVFTTDRDLGDER